VITPCCRLCRFRRIGRKFGRLPIASCYEPYGPYGSRLWRLRSSRRTVGNAAWKNLGVTHPNSLCILPRAVAHAEPTVRSRDRCRPTWFCQRLFLNQRKPAVLTPSIWPLFRAGGWARRSHDAVGLVAKSGHSFSHPTARVLSARLIAAACLCAEVDRRRPYPRKSGLWAVLSG